MAFPDFTMRQLLEAGVHFGHQTRRWNPKMDPYIFGTRNGVHILDLTQTVPALDRALKAVRDVVASGGRILFVGTKRQAQDPVASAAQRCGQYYVNHRWLGGMLTNWRTISNSIRRLRDLEARLEGGGAGFTKKELLGLDREKERLDRALGGIKDMGGLPDMLFVIDTNKESIAITEAQKLGLPVVAILDSNSDPKGIRYPVPGNDDASRAINLYCDLIVAAVLDGIQAEAAASGIDMGEIETFDEQAIEPLDGIPAGTLEPGAGPVEAAAETVPETAESALDAAAPPATMAEAGTDEAGPADENAPAEEVLARTNA